MTKFLLTALFTITLTTASAAQLPGDTNELDRVDPSKVLDLINRIKKSGGSSSVLAQ